MKRLPPVLLFVAFVSHLALPPAPVSARGQAPSAIAATLGELDTQLTADFAKDGIGAVSIGVVSGAKLVWSKHYGYADMEAKRAPTNDSAYRIGSITKQFTALALLQLVEQGKMRLTDPLEKYVPEVKQVQKAFTGTPPITLLQVATMHSGLSREPGCQNHSVGPVSSWQKIVLDCLSQTTYANEPGTTYLYSNIGYASLGLAIERAGGQPFTEQVVAAHPEAARDDAVGIGAGCRHPQRPRARIPAGATRNRIASAPDRELEGRGYRVPNGALFSHRQRSREVRVVGARRRPRRRPAKAGAGRQLQPRVFQQRPTMTSGYGVGFMISDAARR